MSSLKPLDILDIMTVVFNQEGLIERVLEGIFTKTTTPFNFIVIFDGCTDKSEDVAMSYIKKHRPPLMRDLRVTTAPDVFELRANNIGYKMATTDYVVYIQADMIIQEKGWERRLIYPLRAFDDIFAVGSRMAMNVLFEGKPKPTYYDVVGRELFNLPRRTFAIRHSINYAPVVFRTDILKKLNYLDEVFVPGPYCENDLVLRAFEQFGLKSGAFWIGYRSDAAWGKSRQKDMTVDSNQYAFTNTPKFAARHPDLASRSARRFENRVIHDSAIDYIVRDPLLSRAAIRTVHFWRNLKWQFGRKVHALKVRLSL